MRTYERKWMSFGSFTADDVRALDNAVYSIETFTQPLRRRLVWHVWRLASIVTGAHGFFIERQLDRVHDLFHPNSWEDDLLPPSIMIDLRLYEAEVRDSTRVNVRQVTKEEWDK